MSDDGSTPRRPGAPATETELEQAEREFRELEQAAGKQHAFIAQLQADRRNDAAARERLFRLLEMQEAARKRWEALKAAG